VPKFITTLHTIHHQCQHHINRLLVRCFVSCGGPMGWCTYACSAPKTLRTRRRRRKKVEMVKVVYRKRKWWAYFHTMTQTVVVQNVSHSVIVFMDVTNNRHHAASNNCLIIMPYPLPHHLSSGFIVGPGARPSALTVGSGLSGGGGGCLSTMQQDCFLAGLIRDQPLRDATSRREVHVQRRERERDV
jgi:hypothetical protein